MKILIKHFLKIKFIFKLLKHTDKCKNMKNQFNFLHYLYNNKSMIFKKFLLP